MYVCDSVKSPSFRYKNKNETLIEMIELFPIKNIVPFPLDANNKKGQKSKLLKVFKNQKKDLFFWIIKIRHQKVFLP